MTLSEGIILKSRYKIIKKIGGGGYGQVYLAEDTLKESLWAVKEMDVEDLSDKDRTEIREQFWFEAKILVKLSHPQLPKIEDFFEDNEKYYIVMEYIKGKDLFDIIKLSSEPFPVEEVTQWVIKVCNVLEYLHKQKPHAVIFRDLKPENVMLSDKGEIKLIDFGISKLFDINRHTRNYAKAASPYFSSPEQYGGKTTDTRSDIFSLGATMYYIYTGNFPVDAIERAINEIPMSPPSNVNNKIPEKLDNIILKAMELNKENRYQTVEKLREDLLACIPAGEKARDSKKICPKCDRENPYMSRFCGRCGLALFEMSEEPKITTDLEEKIKSVPEKKTVYQGNRFIFIHGSDENPVRILKKPRKSEEYNEQMITENAIISAYHYSVKTSLCIPEESHIIPLKQYFISTDKNIYLSCEEIKLFSFSPGLKGEKLSIILQGRDKKEIFYEDTIELDEEGISCKVLPPHKEGEYILTITGGTVLEEIVLNIYDTLPLLLDIDLKYYRLDTNTEEGNSLTIDLYVSRDGLPFNGLLKLLLLCNNTLIVTLRPDIEEGRFNFKFNTCNDRGPFILKGEGAGTFQVFIPAREKEEKHINIGNYFEIAMAELPGRTDRGIFYKKSAITGNIIEFQELEGEKGRIKVLDDLNIMEIAVINPFNGESNIYDFNNISKHSLLEFQSYTPYSLVHIGTWTDQPWETSGIIISPLKLSPSINVTQKAVPGEEVEIIIETDGMSRCLLMVTDIEIQVSPILRKITRDLYYNISQNIESEQAGKEDNMDKYHAEPLIKDRDGEITYVDLFTVDITAKKVIKMPKKPGLYHIYSYISKDSDFMLLHRTLILEENIFIEFDLPRMMNRDDKITGKIYFSSPADANLLITTCSDYFEGTVSGTGSTEFEVYHAGDITGELSSGSKCWKVTHRILPGAIENTTFSEISLLQKGETVEGENITVYPGKQLLVRCIEAIQNFPMESSEVLSSKLAAKALKYKLLLQNDISGDLKELEGDINSGLTMLNLFINDGLFSLWEGSKPSIDVSIKIMSTMKVFLTVPFPMAHRLIETCTNVLLSKGVRKYSLSVLNSRFMPVSGKIENPILTYLYGPQSTKGQMAELIKLLALKDGDSYYWKGDDFWGGNLEATCYAIKVMYICKEEDFFNRGLKFILKHLKNETLNSTSDTLSFIELLWESNLNGSSSCLVDGKLTTETVIVQGNIEAIDNRLILKKDREEQINYLEKTKKFPLSIDVVPARAIIGEAISIIIKPRIKTVCPVAKIFLPGNMDLLEITPGIQSVTLPIITENLEIKALAVRKGKGKIHVVIEDFYKPDYCGYGESNEIIISEQ
ncbi:MAG: serine/threonine-protein kinase [Candidatus Eremiobacterota bacterium]